MYYTHSFDRWHHRRGRGGYTIAADFDMGTVGIAVCSKKDDFCKKTGRKKAVKRMNETPMIAPNFFTIRAPHVESRWALRERADAVLDALEMIVSKFPNADVHLTYGDSK